MSDASIDGLAAALDLHRDPARAIEALRGTERAERGTEAALWPAYLRGLAYLALGSKVTLVSSREQVLPGEDADAARVIGDVFARNGMQVLNKSRAQSVERNGDGVIVTLSDGRTVEGSHALMAVGSGGAFAQAAALALLENTSLDARTIVEKALNIAADICIYTNRQLTIATLGAGGSAAGG